jgi:FlgD Ig-like domain
MAQQLANLRASRSQFDPDSEQVRIYFDAAEDGYATLVVFNGQGTWVLSLGEIQIRAGANTLVWHGHDADGWPLPAGPYRFELFGFGRDRRPTGAGPLHLSIVLAHRLAEPDADPDLALRRGAWAPTVDAADGWSRAPLR